MTRWPSPWPPWRKHVAPPCRRHRLSTKAWETNPIPSPDGTRILFTSDRDRRGPDRLGPGFEVYTMAVDGTGIVRLTKNRAPDIFPDWQRLP
jgi:Tol biopolymer transport system component